MSNEQQTPIAEFRATITGKMKEEIARQLPKGVDPDRFIRTVITVVQMNPDLLAADRTSLFGACMLAAKDGLLPDGREATIQIYNTNVGSKQSPKWVQKAQYMPMVQGVLKKARNSGEIAYIDAAAVYEKDEFLFERGDNARLMHKPYLGSEDPGPVVCAYMVVKLSNGEIHREVMPRRDIEKVRDASKASSGPGWSNWYDQFAIKAVIKRGAKLLPSSTEEFERVIQHDNDAMGFNFGNKVIDTSEITGSGVGALEDGRAKQSRMDSILKRNGVQREEAEPVEQDQADEAQAEGIKF